MQNLKKKMKQFFSRFRIEYLCAWWGTKWFFHFICTFEEQNKIKKFGVYIMYYYVYINCYIGKNSKISSILRYFF